MNDITHINSNRAQLSSNQTSSTDSRNEATKDKRNESSSASADRETLTNTASFLKDIKQQLNNTSSVDSARVAEVQNAISNGDYTVNTDRIADKMLSFEDFINT